MDASPTRREALRVAGVVGGAAGTAALLAACSPGGSGSDSGSGDDGGGAAGTTIVPTADVPVGGGVSATNGDAPVVVAQPTEGEFVAFSATCPHQGCAVAPSSGEFECPCHGSRFALADGAVLQGPATEGLAPVAVTVSGDSVVSG
ncbi:Rieske (2Fe-2S) protein [Agromyces seonyuensis]|uniref:Cytochrome bc1 complex Rieske iron-sulfur subunit n=1 Tax=Agromyces seonyuensis TaxID=2662446 RepID=A0A6I4NS98_9MICO|nr:Rieske (2Fe-2S) protein [Agromyces seonyuensis]MWB97368.1 Rieske 2Fe-2S domain-containing protein [Agromyces seonyuensis]